LYPLKSTCFLALVDRPFDRPFDRAFIFCTHFTGIQIPGHMAGLW